jgi:hypothetical protein
LPHHLAGGDQPAEALLVGERVARTNASPEKKKFELVRKTKEKII